MCLKSKGKEEEAEEEEKEEGSGFFLRRWPRSCTHYFCSHFFSHTCHTWLQQRLGNLISNQAAMCSIKLHGESEVNSLSRVQLYQASLSMEFSRQGYLSGLPFPSAGDLPNPRIEPGSPTLQADALLSEPLGKPTSWFSSAQSLSRVRLSATPWTRSVPGLPVHDQLPDSTQTHVHWVSDAIQPSHPLSSPSPPALNLSQHQGLFKWVSSLHQVAKVLEFQPQHQSFQWTPRTDLL